MPARLKHVHNFKCGRFDGRVAALSKKLLHVIGNFLAKSCLFSREISEPCWCYVVHSCCLLTVL